MTAVATCGDTAVASARVSDSHTPLRNLRVGPDEWGKFGAVTGHRNRSSWLTEFIGWVIRDPQLWLEFRRVVAARGDDAGDVVLRGLRAYVNRHRQHD